MNLRDLLAHPGVEEVSELRGTFGFMAFHGGSLEERTDIIARQAAERAGASYYGVHQPAGLRQHVPSHRFTADQSDALAEFLEHVDIVITVHGYGRRGLFTTMLLGGTNRALASHVSSH
ncbi:MAG: replication protein, partial [Actinobacteria bacterium]|nr:replication protein [Actinomycetota bacterium]